jgi:hypothetical protein
MLLGCPKLSRGPFSQGDPRAAAVVGEPIDPRIHFALNCGAKSCPPVRVYTPATLEEGLSGAAEAFCTGEVEVGGWRPRELGTQCSPTPLAACRGVNPQRALTAAYPLVVLASPLPPSLVVTGTA